MIQVKVTSGTTDISFTSVMLQSSVANLPEMRIITNDPVVNRLKDGADIKLSMRFIHSRYFVLQREKDFLKEFVNLYDTIKQEGSDTLPDGFKEEITKLMNSIDEESRKYIDHPRAIFDGEIFSLNRSEDATSDTFIISAVSMASYYKRYKISLFMDAEIDSRSAKRMNDLLFYGFPVLFSNTGNILTSIFNSNNDKDGVMSALKTMLNDLYEFKNSDTTSKLKAKPKTKVNVDTKKVPTEKEALESKIAVLQEKQAGELVQSLKDEMQKSIDIEQKKLNDIIAAELKKSDKKPENGKPTDSKMFEFYSYKIDANIMQTFRDYKMNNFFSVPFNFSGNKIRMIFQGKTAELTKTQANQEPDIFSIWKTLLDMFGYDLVFFPGVIDSKFDSPLFEKLLNDKMDKNLITKIQKDAVLEKMKKSGDGKRAMFVVKPLYDDFTPMMFNYIHPEEIVSVSRYRNFFKEYTRFYINFYNNTEQNNYPFKSLFAQVNTIKTAGGTGELSVETKNRIQKIIPERLSFNVRDIQTIFGANIAQTDDVNFYEKARSQIENHKISLSVSESERGIVPLERSFDLFDVKRIFDPEHITDNVVSKGPEINPGKLQLTKNKIDKYSKDFLNTGAVALTVQTVFDAVYGDRNSNIESDFNPTIIPGFPMAAHSIKENRDESCLYGKVVSVTHSATPTSLSTSIQLNRTIDEKQSLCSIYETFKKSDSDKSDFFGQFTSIDEISGALTSSVKNSVSVLSDVHFSKNPDDKIKGIIGANVLGRTADITTYLDKDDIFALKITCLRPITESSNEYGDEKLYAVWQREALNS